jgi:hypothetical protein
MMTSLILSIYLFRYIEAPRPKPCQAKWGMMQRAGGVYLTVKRTEEVYLLL